MIIKFFPHPKTGGSPRRSIDYLLKKNEYEVQVLQGNPRLSVDIAEGLNFFVPNVELDSGKRLSVYYDKSDRPLVDSFKRVINQQYSLSDPDAPEKRQMTVLRRIYQKTRKLLRKRLMGF